PAQRGRCVRSREARLLHRALPVGKRHAAHLGGCQDDAVARRWLFADPYGHATLGAVGAFDHRSRMDRKCRVDLPGAALIDACASRKALSLFTAVSSESVCTILEFARWYVAH